MAFRLTSAAFADGKRIPDIHTCAGADTSPPLAWIDVPVAAASLVLIVSDPDAPVGIWYHWGLFDLPAADGSLPAAYPDDAGPRAPRQAINDFRRRGYGGPCPPRGHGIHHYRFRLIAVSARHLDLHERVDCRDLEAAAEAHHVDETVLIGLYSR